MRDISSESDESSDTEEERSRGTRSVLLGKPKTRPRRDSPPGRGDFGHRDSESHGSQRADRRPQVPPCPHKDIRPPTSTVRKIPLTGRFEDVPGWCIERDTTLHLSGIGYEAYEEDFLPRILTADYLWKMGHSRIVGINIPREEKSSGMQWINKGVMFLKFETRADAETFKERVHGIRIMSGVSRRDHFRDIRVMWARHDMDAFDRRGGLHANKPRYFDEVWEFLPRSVQDTGFDHQ